MRKRDAVLGFVWDSGVKNVRERASTDELQALELCDDREFRADLNQGRNNLDGYP